MNTNRIEKIEYSEFSLFIIDFQNLNEMEILDILQKSTDIAHKANITYGTIYCTEGGFATPKIRQLGKQLSISSEKTGRYIGSAIYGANPFIKMVAKLSNDKIQFGKDKVACIKILQEMYERKRPNHLPQLGENQE